MTDPYVWLKGLLQILNMGLKKSVGYRSKFWMEIDHCSITVTYSDVGFEDLELKGKA